MSNEQESHDDTSGASILAALESDIPSEVEARSIADCLDLFFPSGERPNPKVQSLLNNDSTIITLEAIRGAHESLLQQEYQTSSSSSWTVMKRVAATVCFVQLLLECKDKKPTILSEEEANKMALLLLQNLCKTMKTMLRQTENNDDEEEDDDDEEELNVNVFHAPTVACFTVGALLKEVNPYVSSVPVLLSPLWKGICDVCSALPSTAMPPELAESTLQALVVYLKEGQAQTMTAVEQYCSTRQQQVAPQQQAYHVKVLSFLVARASVLMRVCTNSRRRQTNDEDNDGKPPNTKAIRHAVIILLQLRGLTLATTAQLKRKYKSLSEQDDAFLQAYQQLETKAQQCLVNSWLSTDARSTLERDELNTLLRLQPSQVRDLAALSFHAGKALVLHHLLETTIADASSDSSLREAQVQSLLLICQELLFVTLPLCTAAASSTLLSKCLQTIALTTATCYVKGAPEHQCHLDRLLMKWLAPPTMKGGGELHPLTRELLVSLIPLHVLILCQAPAATRSDSPRSVDVTNTSKGNAEEQACAAAKPLLGLLVKILLDSRTQTGHRRNVASVVIRLLNRRGEGGDSLAKATSIALQQSIAVELQLLVKQDVKVERRKRKKKSKSKEDDTPIVRLLGSFDVDDIRVIVQVLRSTPTFEAPALDRDMACIARDLTAVDLTAKNQSYSVGNYSRNTLSLLLSLLSSEESVAATDGKSVPELFKTKTGMDMCSFTTSLVQWLGQQQNRVAKRTQGSLRTAHSVVIVACLHFICSSFGHVEMGEHELRAIVTLVKEYARLSCQVLLSNAATLDAGEKRSASSIIFAITPLLAGITKVVPASCPADILECIASTFKMLFETNAWPIVARTVTSLVRFASTIPSTHQGILPECIPPKAQGLLQCRLQGIVFRDTDSHTEAESAAVNDTCRIAMKQLIPDLEDQDSLYVSASDDYIVEGSYIVTMPTMDGRKAQVIFAPGQESLEDIKYMLGAQDMNDVEIRKLQQVRLTGKGEGCRFLSKSL